MCSCPVLRTFEHFNKRAVVAHENNEQGGSAIKICQGHRLTGEGLHHCKMWRFHANLEVHRGSLGAGNVCGVHMGALVGVQGG